MEFPEEIKSYILSYLPHPYKKPLHLDAINKSSLFADFTIEREMIFELEKDIDDTFDFLWLDSYIEYKKYRNMAIMGENYDNWFPMLEMQNN